MILSEIEKSGLRAVITAAWSVGSRSGEWSRTSWMLFGMKVNEEDNELRSELALLEAIAEMRGELV